MASGQTTDVEAKPKARKGVGLKVERLDMKRPAYFEDVALDDIRIDGGTQHRDLNPEVLAEYADMLERTPPPPAHAIRDENGDTWLWDGFHRFHVKRDAKHNGMRLSIRRGTKEDATWLSYSANKGHGLRREAGDVRRVIAEALTHFPGKSAKEVAEHVGASSRYVEQVRAELRDGGGAAATRTTREVKRGGATYNMDVSALAGKREATGNGKASESPAADKTRQRGGESPESAFGSEPEPVAVPVPDADTDEAGNKLTDPAHREVFGRAKEYGALLRQLSDVKTAVRSAVDKRDPLFRWVNIDEFESDVANARETLKLTKPFALCPAHADDKHARTGCKWCGGCGYVPKPKYDLAAKAIEVGVKAGQLKTATANQALKLADEAKAAAK